MYLPLRILRTWYANRWRLLAKSGRRDVCLFLARPDAFGDLQVEASFGAAAERYHRAMQAGAVPENQHGRDHSGGAVDWRTCLARRTD